jgi:cytochrome c biogenesis protein CcmG/thiol:disulfide interchange protein DsbE
MAQSELTNTAVKNLKGKEVSFNTIPAKEDTATIVSFWATWCIPCVTELEAINDKLGNWRKGANFKFVAISEDDARTTAKVRSFVKGKGWDFDVYTDSNNELKRIFNITDIPHVLIIKKGNIVYQHTGYLPGNEEELLSKIKNLQ